jgi:hypothetical protein
MNQLFHLIGLALPDNPAIFRLKVLLFGGIGGLGAGLLVMTSGLEGSVLRGGLIAACGFALMGITVRSRVREARKRGAERIALQRRQKEEDREERERLIRQQSCDHSWILDDPASDYGVFPQMCCTKCGAIRNGRS